MLVLSCNLSRNKIKNKEEKQLEKYSRTTIPKYTDMNKVVEKGIGHGN